MRSTWRPAASSWTKRTALPVQAAATVRGASARPSLSITASRPSSSQHQMVGGGSRREDGTATKPPSPVGASVPEPMRAMLVRTETGVSAGPAKRREARSRRARDTSAR